MKYPLHDCRGSATAPKRRDESRRGRLRVCATLAAAAVAFAQTPTALRVGANDLKADVSFLASDALEGRATPSKGLDIAADERGREAADDAMRTGQATLSQRLLLALDERRLPGFLLLLPIYEKGSGVETPTHRARALRGWTFAAIRIDELMEGITGLT